MDTIEIAVNGTSAVTVSAVAIICGNTGYKAHFTFSDEWGAYTAKTAVFTFFSMRTGKTNQYEVLFEGDTVEIPVVTNTVSLTIGVIAGDVKTTTDANVPCMNSNTSSVLLHDDPPPDIYEQLLEYLAGLQGGGMTGQMTAIFGGVLTSISGTALELGFVCKGTAASSAQFTVPKSGNFKLMVIALNSEASTFALNLAVQVNGSAVEVEEVAYNAYSGSGTNRRNHRVVSYSANFSVGDTVSIDLTNRSGYTSFVYALLDETYQFGSLMQTVTTADATASGSYSADAVALYGTFDSSAGGTIRIADAAAGTTVTTDNPGTNYKSAYIFWFEKEES